MSGLRLFLPLSGDRPLWLAFDDELFWCIEEEIGTKIVHSAFFRQEGVHDYHGYVVFAPAFQGEVDQGFAGHSGGFLSQ